MLTSATPFVACTASAPNAVRAYAGGGLTDWFLPSKDELNAMCNYSRTWTGTPSTGACTGTQNGAFAAGAYGFASASYWSSGQLNASTGQSQSLNTGTAFGASKGGENRVRPIRTF
jgi:hypothetical protein